MTEREMLIAAFNRENIGFNEEGNTIEVERGYIGFVIEVLFRDDGSLKDLGAYES